MDQIFFVSRDELPNQFTDDENGSEANSEHYHNVLLIKDQNFVFSSKQKYVNSRIAFIIATAIT